MHWLAAAVPVSSTARFGVALIVAGLGCDARFFPDSNGASAADGVDGQEATRHVLPADVAEVSGLAVHRGRVFAHDDEVGRIYEIDPRTGSVVKSFTVGRPHVTGDFEGLARANDRFFLVTSQGRLVEFSEGEDGAQVDYRVLETGLRRVCEVEGLDYDARTESLLLACKTPRSRELRGKLVVFEYSLQRQALDPAPRLELPLDFLQAADRKRELHPSGIALHPETGAMFVLAARERLIIEVGNDDVVHGVRELSADHPQAEGIAFLDDGTLLIADERAGGGLLTVYAPRSSLTGDRPHAP